MNIFLIDLHIYGNNFLYMILKMRSHIHISLMYEYIFNIFIDIYFKIQI